jgi:hypothetical protein
MLVNALGMQRKGENVAEGQLVKDVQWLAETLFLEGKLFFFESCNQPAIGNAKSALLGMGVFKKKNIYISIGTEYAGREGEKKLLSLLAQVGQYRMLPVASNILEAEIG